MTKVTAKRIAKDAGLEFEHALYRRTGDWYHILERFPGALLDDSGYIPFMIEKDYKSFVKNDTTGHIRENRDANTLIIKNGISQCKEYIHFAERHVFPEQLDPNQRSEGAAISILVNRYERDAGARKLCLSKWGLSCMACTVNFAHVYGSLGEGFMHVHHLTPLSSIKTEYVVDPERDMRPVCPNCHAMLHRQEPPYSIDELRTILGKVAQSNSN